MCVANARADWRSASGLSSGTRAWHRPFGFGHCDRRRSRHIYPILVPHVPQNSESARKGEPHFTQNFLGRCDACGRGDVAGELAGRGFCWVELAWNGWRRGIPTRGVRRFIMENATTPTMATITNATAAPRSGFTGPPPAGTTPPPPGSPDTAKLLRVELPVLSYVFS